MGLWLKGETERERARERKASVWRSSPQLGHFDEECRLVPCLVAGMQVCHRTHLPYPPNPSSALHGPGSEAEIDRHNRVS